ncbi:hypothetical protein [Clostridium saccharobutylicum]|nr:hypothetical protein [Clostridium saccharobutylicum]
MQLNIHKSVLEEQINNIEENKKQNDKSEKESHGMIKRIIDDIF